MGVRIPLWVCRLFPDGMHHHMVLMINLEFTTVDDGNKLKLNNNYFMIFNINTSSLSNFFFSHQPICVNKGSWHSQP